MIRAAVVDVDFVSVFEGFGGKKRIFVVVQNALVKKKQKRTNEPTNQASNQPTNMRMPSIQTSIVVTCITFFCSVLSFFLLCYCLFCLYFSFLFLFFLMFLGFSFWGLKTFFSQPFILGTGQLPAKQIFHARLVIQHP